MHSTTPEETAQGFAELDAAAQDRIDRRRATRTRTSAAEQAKQPEHSDAMCATFTREGMPHPGSCPCVCHSGKEAVASTPTENKDIRHVAAGNLGFLLSLMRSGDALHPEEEKVVRSVIDELEAAAASLQRDDKWIEGRKAGIEAMRQYDQREQPAESAKPDISLLRDIQKFLIELDRPTVEMREAGGECLVRLIDQIKAGESIGVPIELADGVFNRMLKAAPSQQPRAFTETEGYDCTGSLVDLLCRIEERLKAPVAEHPAESFAQAADLALSQIDKGGDEDSTEATRLAWNMACTRCAQVIRGAQPPVAEQPAESEKKAKYFPRYIGQEQQPESAKPCPHYPFTNEQSAQQCSQCGSYLPPIESAKPETRWQEVGGGTCYFDPKQQAAYERGLKEGRTGRCDYMATPVAEQPEAVIDDLFPRIGRVFADDDLVVGQPAPLPIQICGHRCLSDSDECARPQGHKGEHRHNGAYMSNCNWAEQPTPVAEDIAPRFQNAAAFMSNLEDAAEGEEGKAALRERFAGLIQESRRVARTNTPGRGDMLALCDALEMVIESTDYPASVDPSSLSSADCARVFCRIRYDNCDDWIGKQGSGGYVYSKRGINSKSLNDARIIAAWFLSHGAVEEVASADEHQHRYTLKFNKETKRIDAQCTCGAVKQSFKVEEGVK